MTISAFSARDLRALVGRAGYESSRLPHVLAVPLPEEIRGVPRARRPPELPDQPVRFVSVGTVEPGRTRSRRCAHSPACAPDARISTSVSTSSVQSITAVADEVEGLAASEKRIGLHEYLPDDAVWDLVAGSHATVFMSLYEGFGLPIAESLWQGTPCLCSDHGSMIEIAAAGGCLTVPAADSYGDRARIRASRRRSVLSLRGSHEARTRTLRSWRDYGETTFWPPSCAAPTFTRRRHRDG